MNTKKIRTKENCGIGGIKCPCCRRSGSLKDARTTHNRIVRRRLNAVLRNDLKDFLVNGIEEN